MKKIVAFLLSFLLSMSCLASLSSADATSKAPSTTMQCGQLFVDYSNLEHGTVKVAVLDPDDSLRYKLVVEHEEQVYYYNLDLETDDIIIPLQMGNGIYKLLLVEQVEDTIYHGGIGTAYFDLEIDDMEVWLQPNAKVDFSSPEELLKELKWVIAPWDLTERDKFNSITEHMHETYGYDYITFITRARTVKEYTDLNSLLKERIALCEGLSAMTVAFLRLSGIPSRLVIGKFGGGTHAWVEAFIDDETILFDPSYPDYKEHLKQYHPIRYY